MSRYSNSRRKEGRKEGRKDGREEGSNKGRKEGTFTLSFCVQMFVFSLAAQISAMEASSIYFCVNVSKSSKPYLQNLLLVPGQE